MELPDLYPEILFQICELFCEHCRGETWYESRPLPEWWRFSNPRHSLLALSLVCKSIGSVAQRVLHHNLGFLKHEKAIPQLCSIISNKPELAKDLRWADLSILSNDTAPEDIVQGWLPETVNKFSRYLLDGEQDIPIPYMTLLSALILLQAPNLEQLDDNVRDGMTPFTLLNRDAVIQDGALPARLKSLRLGCWINSIDIRQMTWIDLSLDGIGGFINTFKELESLSVHLPLASGVDDRVSFQCLRVLRLESFHLPQRDFENLISLMPRLEGLAISRLDRHLEGEPDLATVPQILQVLAQRNNTLRRLELDISCTHDNVQLLRTLTNLEELNIRLGKYDGAPHSYLKRIGKQALVRTMPPSLRKLGIDVQKTGTFTRATNALITYISSTYRESPHDQRLQMVHFLQNKSWSAPERAIIERGCQEWAKNGTLVFESMWMH